MAVATLLFPARDRFGGQALPEAIARAVGRGDALAPGAAGAKAQLLRHFDLVPRGWPAAALTRSQDASDAASAQWLRADPAWVRPDINGARLFAIGDGMQLGPDDADALLPSLRTLFGDAGFPIDAPVPSRWYLRLPTGARLPDFPAPEDALGADLFEALVGIDPAQDAARRRWRSLLTEAQVILHNHPWNGKRSERGLPPVNSLWFWGGGSLPAAVTTTCARVRSDDVLVRALAARSGIDVQAKGRGFDTPTDDLLVDLRDARDLAQVSAQWLGPALAALRGGGLEELRLDFGDGAGCALRRRHWWRVWRTDAAGFSRLPPLPQQPGDR